MKGNFKDLTVYTSPGHSIICLGLLSYKGKLMNLKKVVRLLYAFLLNLPGIIHLKAGDVYEGRKNDTGGQTLWIN